MPEGGHLYEVFGSGRDERVDVLMQHGCKSEHSVAEKVVNIFLWAPGVQSQNCKNQSVHK